MSGGSPEGVVLVDKPPGMTSHDAVDAVRRALGTRKVGHAGTLDPMATGLLVIGVGRATRLLRFLGETPKTYEGTFRLGIETSTLDADGEVTRTHAVEVTDEAIAAAMAAKVGTSEQTPPAFSAVKVGGRKLYDAAREGDMIEAPPRPITVDRFDLVDRRGDDVDFLAVVGGGTYVRVLAADVGAVARLRRAPDPSAPDRDRFVLRGRRGAARPSGNARTARGRGRAPASGRTSIRTRHGPRRTDGCSRRPASRDLTACTAPTVRWSGSGSTGR